jgi:hypothetical protein
MEFNSAFKGLRLRLSELQFQSDMEYVMRGGALSVGLMKTN